MTDFLPVPDLLNELLRYFGRSKRPVVLLRRGKDGSCIKETVLKDFNCIGRFHSELVGLFLEAPQCLLLGDWRSEISCFEDSVEEFLSLIGASGKRFIE